LIQIKLAQPGGRSFDRTKPPATGAGVHRRNSGMNPLGLALIVGGAAFLLSGLIFLLPQPRGLRGDDTVEERREKAASRLGEMRRERGDLS
jgi:hypothetical protein